MPTEPFNDDNAVRDYRDAWHNRERSSNASVWKLWQQKIAELRERWKDEKGEDTLHEVAFGPSES